jgi:cation:H+ antiporter
MLENILLLALGLIVLIAGGEFLVRGASSLALKFKISPMVVGLTIVSFGTSAPELLISLNSALKGSADLAMGNVIGSNISNIALILGLTSIIYPIAVGKDSRAIDWPVCMGSALLLYLLILDGTLVMWEGLLFVSLLACYIGFLLYKSYRGNKIKVDEEKVTWPLRAYLKDIGFLFGGGLGLYFGSDWFVNGAQNIAIGFGISERIIGLTIVALGTSLPELAASIIAAIKKEADIAFGNIIGSNIFNILSILGITSIITPIAVSEELARVDMLWMMGITLLLFPMMFTLKKITRLEGMILLSLYVVYIGLVLT